MSFGSLANALNSEYLNQVGDNNVKLHCAGLLIIMIERMGLTWHGLGFIFLSWTFKYFYFQHTQEVDSQNVALTTRPHESSIVIQRGLPLRDSQEADRHVSRMWGRESFTKGVACWSKHLTFSNYAFLSLTLCKFLS